MLVRYGLSQKSFFVTFLCFELVERRTKPRSSVCSAMKDYQSFCASSYKQVKFAIQSSGIQRKCSTMIWSKKKSIERLLNSAMCKLVVMILIALTLLCNYLMIVFYKCLWVFHRLIYFRYNSVHVSASRGLYSSFHRR